MTDKTKYLDDAGLKRFYDNLSEKFLDRAEVLSAIDDNKADPLDNYEVISSMVDENEIWIKAPTGWEAMTVQVESEGEPIALTAAIADPSYYIFNASSIANDADQFVVSDGDTNSTSALTGLSTKAAIEALKGKVIYNLAASAATFKVAPEDAPAE